MTSDHSGPCPPDCLGHVKAGPRRVVRSEVMRKYRKVPSEQAGYGPGQWVVQYKDPVVGRWFDVGDPLSEEEAQSRLDELTKP